MQDSDIPRFPEATPHGSGLFPLKIFRKMRDARSDLEVIKTSLPLFSASGLWMGATVTGDGHPGPAGSCQVPRAPDVNQRISV